MGIGPSTALPGSEPKVGDEGFVKSGQALKAFSQLPTKQSNGPKKDTTALFKNYYLLKSEKEQLFLNEKEIEEKAMAKATEHCHEETMRARCKEWILGNESQRNVAVRIFLSAPLGDQIVALPKYKQVLLSLTASFGYVHAGIQIGDVCLDWFSTSFVHIRRMTIPTVTNDGAKKGKKATTPIIVFNPYSDAMMPVDAKVVNEIVKTVLLWNRTKMYDNKFANCQDFVQDVLQKLKDSFGWKYNIFGHTDILSQYLQQLRDHPEEGSRLIFFNGQKIVFKTHEELDSFHKENQGALSHTDKALLKCFHRAFQIEESLQSDTPIEKLFSTCIEGPPSIYASNKKKMNSSSAIIKEIEK